MRISMLNLYGKIKLRWLAMAVHLMLSGEERGQASKGYPLSCRAKRAWTWQLSILHCIKQLMKMLLSSVRTSGRSSKKRRRSGEQKAKEQLL